MKDQLNGLLPASSLASSLGRQFKTFSLVCILAGVGILSSQGAGFSINGGAEQTGVVTGAASGDDSVVGSGSFKGAYVQNQANKGGRPAIGILSDAFITNPGAQGWFLTNSSGGDNYYYTGGIEFNQGGCTNLGTIDCTNGSMPASSYLIGFDYYVYWGLPSGSGRDFYNAAGVLGWSYNSGTHGTTTILNGSFSNTNATIKSTITGSGQSTAYGIFARGVYGATNSYNLDIENHGTVSGAVQNVHGSASGIYGSCNYGGINEHNWWPGTVIASASFYTTAMFGNANYGPIYCVNSGTATANSTSGGFGENANQSRAVGVDLYAYSGDVMFINAGQVTSTSAGSDTNITYGFFGWAQGGGLTFTNTGTIIATSSSTGEAKGVYCGDNGEDVIVVNTGTLKGTAGSLGGWGLGIEEDTGHHMDVYNSGPISHNNGIGLFLYDTFGGSATLINAASGSISGGLQGIGAAGYKGSITLYTYGNISGGSALALGPGNDTVHVLGLPTVSGTMNGAGGANTLDLQINGTLQTVNGASATKGNILSAYGLGASGNIVVSGKTYAWNNFTVGGYVNSLPSPWTTLDIGAVGAAGTADYSSGTFTIQGSGADIAGNADEFRYAYQPSKGDSSIQVRVASVENTSSYAKAGVMIRETMEPGSAFAMVAVTPSQGIVFECRTSMGAWHTSVWAAGLTAPYWVRVVRSGNTFTGYRSADGSTWTSIGSQTFTMSDGAYVGMAVTSHADGNLCTGAFSNVSVTP